MTTENKLSTSAASSAEKAEERPVIAPNVDVFENENELLVVADLPGVVQGAMNIHFEKNRLTIEGKRELPRSGGARLSEIEMADFRRTFLVPQGIDAAQISAELSQGVLSVHLPKHASAKPRRIEIRN